MASLGAHFIIAGQQEREGVSAVKRIREENREAKGHSPHNPVWFCVSLALDITDWLESEHTFSKSPSQGVSMVLYTALSPSLEGERGGYWSNGRTEMSTPNTYNPRLQLGLWDFSCRLVSLQEQHQP
uniref:dehydrogenase/reductase SDR family member on chromosome X-like n=1 Tax=Oncorhynchus gorbuscha TaxID=8017 RepID=UPI001EAE988E|nr:dehydrogenase/reductase SDR family member on chromosome X-like [Oncorhynchus gorbuscha]